MGKIGKEEEKYASLESQLGNACCMTEDTEEMFWLRESDDYSSRVRLGNLLAAQYRFREAVEIYRTAEKIRWDDPMLYIRLGGALLTLRRFDEAKEAYKRSFDTGIKEKTAAYPMGVWHYLRGEYAQAASWFGKCLPCKDEMAAAVFYWYILSCCRGNLPDDLMKNYHSDIQAGHHTAYKMVIEMFCGNVEMQEAEDAAKNTDNALDAVVIWYGVLVYMESRGYRIETAAVMDKILKRNSVWPCISYLAAWNDKNSEKSYRKTSPPVVCEMRRLR